MYNFYSWRKLPKLDTMLFVNTKCKTQSYQQFSLRHYTLMRIRVLSSYVFQCDAIVRLMNFHLYLLNWKNNHIFVDRFVQWTEKIICISYRSTPIACIPFSTINIFILNLNTPCYYLNVHGGTDRMASIAMLIMSHLAGASRKAFRSSG